MSIQKHTDEPINEPINEPIKSVLEYIRTHEGCKRKQIADAFGMTLITVRRTLSKLSDQIVYKGSNKTGGYYLK